MAFPFLTVFMVFIIVLALRYSYLNKRQDKMFQDYDAREDAADRTPTADLSSITYLSVPLERFPIGRWPEEEISMIEQDLKAISQKPLLNLTGQTNTDLKLAYGAKNLETMSEIGENFNTLTMLLVDYAKSLMEKKDYEGAATVLEYGASAGSDISSNYTLLGDCYKELGRDASIQALKEQVPSKHLLLEKKVLSYLGSL